MKGAGVPVPLGSDYASLMATFQTNLAGGPAGAAGDFGILQVKRTSSTTGWVNVDYGYAYTTTGVPNPGSLYGTVTYQTIVDLRSLPDGSGTPSQIDVRMVVYPAFSPDGGFTNVAFNAVCDGELSLSF
jgi:hypothetical protein